MKLIIINQARVITALPQITATQIRLNKKSDDQIYNLIYKLKIYALIMKTEQHHKNLLTQQM